MLTLIISVGAAVVFAGSIFLGWYLDRRWGRGAKEGMSPEMELEHTRGSQKLYP